MYRPLIQVMLAIVLLLPTSVLSQEATRPVLSPVAPGTLPAQLAPGLTQDTQFLALLRARDSQFALLQELRNINSFYDNFRSRIRPFLNDSVLAARPESDRENINLALINLDDFAKKINSAPDRNTAIDAAKEFDKEYPLFEPNARIPNGQGQIFRQLSPLNKVPLRTEQSRANDVFDNVSIENQEWKNRYENVFFLIEQRLETLESARGRGRFPSLKKLPLQFSKPCGCVIERSFYSGND